MFAKPITILRRIVLSLIVITVVGLSLAAMAAVGIATVPTQSLTPEVHRSGEDGYFRLTVPLPAGDSGQPTVFSVAVQKGDVWLTHAQGAPLAETDGDDDNDGVAPSRTVTVTGRYGKAGPVRLTISGRRGEERIKPLLVLSFTIPSGDADRPEVREAWARQQDLAFRSSDPRGADSFSSYWDLVVAKRYGISPRRSGLIRSGRREPPDLYSIFTGAAAIQESLQLELLGSSPVSPDQRTAIGIAKSRDETIPLDTLAGPAAVSHPFREMLKGRAPKLPPLANAIPADQYAVFFGNITKQQELADLMDEWGGNLLHQAEATAQDYRVRERLSRRLCLEESWLTRLFGDRVIADMALTGNDPFLKEGTAFTVLFTLKDAELFRKQMEKNHAAATKTAGAGRATFTVDGRRGFSAVSPDRGISSHVLIVGSTAIVSTSRPALERSAAALAERVPSLARADDFRYMRTIFPQDDADEDIFVYLSDPHIRALTGPRWKIGESRRMRCSAQLGLLANARLWFRAEHRREPTVAELATGGYLGDHPLACPDHGSYSLDSSGTPYCSVHNRQGNLTPVGEVPLERVTAGEAAEYRAFVENYNRYWTQFFDPIGIRVRMGKNIRIQTCILPLIKNSWYDGLIAFSGNKPGTLSDSDMLPRTIMALRGRMAPDWLAKTGLAERLTAGGRAPDWLGTELHLNLCDGQVLFTTGDRALGLMGREMGRSSLEPLIFGYLGAALNLPTYLTVNVTDPLRAQQAVPELFRALTRGRGGDEEMGVETYAMEEYRGVPIYVASFNLWIAKLRLYSAVVGDRLVIASRMDLFSDLVVN